MIEMVYLSFYHRQAREGGADHERQPRIGAVMLFGKPPGLMACAPTCQWPTASNTSSACAKEDGIAAARADREAPWLHTLVRPRDQARVVVGTTVAHMA